jgi:hypothetical protein
VAHRLHDAAVLLVLVLVSFALPRGSSVRAGFAIVYLGLRWWADDPVRHLGGERLRLEDPQQFFTRLHWGRCAGSRALFVFGRRFSASRWSGPDPSTDTSTATGPATPGSARRHAGRATVPARPGDPQLDRAPSASCWGHLQIDPIIDVLLGRLPVAFIDPNPADRGRDARSRSSPPAWGLTTPC